MKISGIDSLDLPGISQASFSSLDLIVHSRSLFTRQTLVSLVVREPRLNLDQGWPELLSAPLSDKSANLRLAGVQIINGSLFFRRDDFLLQAEGLNARLTSTAKDERRIFAQLPNLTFSIPLSGESVSFNGHLTADILEQRHSFRVNRLTFHESGLSLESEGRIYKDDTFYLNARINGNPERILHPLLKEFSPRAELRASALLQKNRSGNISVSADFNAENFQIGGESFSDLAGEMSWTDLSNVMELQAVFQCLTGPGRITIQSDPQSARIDIGNLDASQAVSLLEINNEIPMAGLVKACRLFLQGKEIRGQAMLEPLGTSQDPWPPFHFSGPLSFLIDQSSGQVSFSSENMLFKEGSISLSGSVDEPKELVELQIRGQGRGLENLAPYLRYYIDLDLEPWVLRGGESSFSIDLRDRAAVMDVDADFVFRSFSAQGAPISELQGKIENRGIRSNGNFTLNDKDLRGRAFLQRRLDDYQIEFSEIEGEAAKALTVLDLDLDFQGWFSGSFNYHEKGEGGPPEINGLVKAEKLSCYSLPMSEVSSELFSNLAETRLSGIDFSLFGGRGQGWLNIDFELEKYSLEAVLQDMDLQRLNSDFQGLVRVSARGRGGFMNDPIEIELDSPDIRYYQDRPFALQGIAEVLTDFNDYSLELESKLLSNGNSTALNLRLEQKAGVLSGGFESFLPDLDLIMPWTNNQGELRIMGQIRSEAGLKPSAQGVATFRGGSLAIPNFSHVLEDFSGHITFKDFDFNLRSLRGVMGGGPVEGNGRFFFNQGEVEVFSLNFSGRNMNLFPMDRVACRLNGDLTLRLVQEEFLLQGHLHFLNTRWEREIDEDISFYTNPNLTDAESKFLEMLRFDIRLSGDENAQIENSFVQGRGRFNLLLTGSPDFPLLTGFIEGQQGFISFADRRFSLLKARIAFNNKFFIDPQINLEAEAYIQNYRVLFTVSGTANRPRPEFVSSPPLPPSDVLALISLGEIFRRWRSTEISSQIGTASLITGMLSEELRQRAGRLLGVDLFRLDALFTGQPSLNTSRLTIGKSLAKDLIFVYSTNLYTLKQEILYLKFQMSPAVSLIGMRNEEGRFSIDVQFRKRY